MWKFVCSELCMQVKKNFCHPSSTMLGGPSNLNSSTDLVRLSVRLFVLFVHYVSPHKICWSTNRTQRPKRAEGLVNQNGLRLHTGIDFPSLSLSAYRQGNVRYSDEGNNNNYILSFRRGTWYVTGKHLHLLQMAVC